MVTTDKPILLVEDNHQDELLTLRSLRKGNVVNRIDVTRDGQQALDYLFCEGEYGDRDAAEMPVVVLLDINLPRVNGLDVLAKLRADPRTRLLPVVILTSSDEDRDRQKSYQSGCNSFVHKPVNFKEFADSVAQIGVYWCATNIPPHD
jgi:CheY-like chemotaxis protein